LPQDPHECFEFAAQSFDLADRLQTPVFVLLDLDIGMNERLSAPFAWDDSRKMDRGKVMTAADLDSGRTFGRYLDVDHDGIAYRTYPGTHPAKGAFFTRGTSRDEYAKYTEEGPVYQRNMERLLLKFETAKQFVPRPIRRDAAEGAKYGAIYFGSTAPAMDEAVELLAAQGISLNLLRVRAFPFHDDVLDFVAAHDKVFVVEQNRDGQLRSLLINEGEIDPARLVRVLHYDGTPITARLISAAIADSINAAKVVPLRKAAP